MGFYSNMSQRSLRKCTAFSLTTQALQQTINNARQCWYIISAIEVFFSFEWMKLEDIFMHKLHHLVSLNIYLNQRLLGKRGLDLNLHLPHFKYWEDSFSPGVFFSWTVPHGRPTFDHFETNLSSSVSIPVELHLLC